MRWFHLLFFTLPNIVFSQSTDKDWPTFNQPAPLIPNLKVDFKAAKPLVPIEKCSQSKHIAITFDDGPGDGTTALLDYLDQTKQKVTFFVLGQASIEYPQLLKRAYDAGHQIAMHSWSHATMSELSQDQILAEIVWNMRAIQSVLGVVPRYFRTPFGEMEPKILQVLSSMGLEMVYWSYDSFDWKLASGQTTANKIQTEMETLGKQVNDASTGAGEITLHHDIVLNAVQTDIAAINKMRAAAPSVTFSTVGQCMGVEPARWYFPNNQLPPGLDTTIKPPPVTPKDPKNPTPRPTYTRKPKTKTTKKPKTRKNKYETKRTPNQTESASETESASQTEPASQTLPSPTLDGQGTLIPNTSSSSGASLLVPHSALVLMTFFALIHRL